MFDRIPNADEMIALIGQTIYDVWQELCIMINEKYEMEHLWNKGGKNGRMNLNTVEAVKRFVRYMQKNIVSDL
nr:DUF3788 family protein [Lacrimispora celerecrescens]